MRLVTPAPSVNCGLTHSHGVLGRSRMHVVTAARTPSSSHVGERGRRRVFVFIGSLDIVVNACPSKADGADLHLAISHLDCAEWIVKKGLIPAAGLLRPGPREDTAIDHDRPDPEEAMVRPRSSTDSQDPALVDGADERLLESFGHGCSPRCASRSRSAASPGDCARMPHDRCSSF